VATNIEPTKRYIFASWHEAAQTSRWAKAISAHPITIYIPRGIFQVNIVKPRYGDPYAVYATAQGIRVHDWKPTNTAVDRIGQWKAW
jgi:hypothetical protein